MIDKNIKILNEIITYITLYVPFLTIISGTLGSLFNIITFTSKRLRYNSCAFYFLCSTMFDLIYLLLGGITRLISDHFTKLLPHESVVFCKCRIYLVIVLPTLSTYFIMLSSIDRCLLTSKSRKWRNLSQINIAWRVTILLIIYSLISSSHIFFFYELRGNDLNNNKNLCVPHAGIYTIFISVYLFLTSPFLTYIIMFTCSLITLIRIRTSRYRMRLLNNRRRRQRNIDFHLMSIMFVQVGLGMLLTLFRCSFLAYSLWTNNIKKNFYRINIELFLDKFTLIIFYMNFAKSFFVNTLTSPLFRQVFYQRMINLLIYICPFIKKKQTIISHKMIKRQNQIELSIRHL